MSGQFDVLWSQSDALETHAIKPDRWMRLKSLDEDMARLRLLRGPDGEAEEPLCVLTPAVSVEASVLVAGRRVRSATHS